MKTIRVIAPSLVVTLQRIFDYLIRTPEHGIRLWILVGMMAWLGYYFYQQPQSSMINVSIYDNLVRHRWLAPSPDPEIVIVDIDEASLAYMSKDYGRWPWPRDTLAAVLSWLEYQGAQAVIFDILFADPDRLNKSADASFSDAVAQSKVSYFPVLRLNPSNDTVSELLTSQLRGFASREISGAQDIKLAAVAPLFESAVATERLGYNNVYADNDGVLRHYRYWEEKDGWLIWSLPARLALDLGWGLPKQNAPLINWHRERLAHATIPFADIWRISQSLAGQRRDSRFKGKIVVIGATATSLFDVKTTPIATIHPGVDVLATAIDNAKNHRYLLQVPPWFELVMAISALIFMFVASKTFQDKKIKWAIFLAPSLLMGISFVSLHWGSWYLDLTVPASQSFLFFALVSTCRAQRLNYWSRSQALGTHGYTQAWVIRTTLLTTSNLLDELTSSHPSISRFCLQSLLWHRRTDRSDIEFWLVRISAETRERLSDDAQKIHASIDRWNCKGLLQAIFAGTVEEFALQPTTSGWRNHLKHLVGVEAVEYPFLEQDRRLALAALGAGESISIKKNQS